MSKTKVITLESLINNNDPYYPLRVGDEFDYEPWHFEYQGMTESERIRNGLYVFCDGQGSFRRYREGVEATRVGK